MFLPFGRNNGRGTSEMLPLYVERISMMNGVSKTCSSVPVLILMMDPSKTTENKCRSSKNWCRTYFKEQSISSNDKETSYNCCTWGSTITWTYKDRSCREWTWGSEWALTTTIEGSSSSKRRWKSSRLSSKSTVCDSTNKPAMSAKNSSTKAGARRQHVPYCVGPIIVAMYAHGLD